MLSQPPPGTEADDEYERRFAGVARVYGDAAFARLSASHAVVVGVGGVGSWTAEALARNGIGRITLIDMDVVVASNVNRQLPALTGNFGRGKAEVLAERIHGINPRAQVRVVDDYLTRDNAPALLDPQPDLIFDCCDDAKAKLTLALHARRHRNVLVVCGAAGGKVDPGRLAVEDLARTEQDPLLARLRKRLRKHHGYPEEPGKPFHITCVYSDEPITAPPAGLCASSGLNCAGYGSLVTVTASMGLMAVSTGIAMLLRRPPRY
ncbi:MAG: tRNA threonylcarbamoyladenosine dehydratase, partial [Perlucidibaca sp.]